MTKKETTLLERIMTGKPTKDDGVNMLMEIHHLRLSLSAAECMFQRQMLSLTQMVGGLSK